MKIAAHCLVKNEVRFVWYAIMSVIEHVDRVRLWDTGSTDGTLEIIKEILKTEEAKKTQVFFKKVNVRPFEESSLRNEMLDAESGEHLRFRDARNTLLDETTADWFIIVDGDEIWWEDSIKKVVETIRARGEKLESIVVPTINLVGDIFHYQEEAAGRYRLAGRFGHFSLRAVNRKIPGLHWSGPHGRGGWADGDGRMIQDRDSKKILFLNAPYLHATHLQRAGRREKDFKVIKRAMKLKYEVGIPFPKDFYYPEVFFRPRPAIVPSPWVKMDAGFMTRAAIQTPIKKIKRRFWRGKVGY